MEVRGLSRFGLGGKLLGGNAPHPEPRAPCIANIVIFFPTQMYSKKLVKFVEQPASYDPRNEGAPRVVPAYRTQLPTLAIVQGRASVPHPKVL